MSAVTFGPPVVIDGPLPVAPPRSLLTVPGVLQEARDSRWTNGAAIYGYPVGEPETWDPCGDASPANTKSDESSFPTPDFAAFIAYLPITCSSFSLATDPAGFAQRAEVALDARISFAIEKALSQGVPMVANPYLADASVDVLAAGAAVSPDVGLAWLEDAIGATAQAGMIHATPAVVSRWFDHVGDPSVDGPLTTPNGTPVASGGGYKGSTPFGEGAAGTGEEWVYATGPVKVWLAMEATLNIKDVLDRATNDVTFRAERYALVEWDTSLQAAVLVDWGT